MKNAKEKIIKEGKQVVSNVKCNEQFLSVSSAYTTEREQYLQLFLKQFISCEQASYRLYSVEECMNHGCNRGVQTSITTPLSSSYV